MHYSANDRSKPIDKYVGDGEPIILTDVNRVVLLAFKLQYKVHKCVTFSPFPKGENYGSTRLRVKLIIKAKGSKTKEKLWAYAKLYPRAKFQLDHLNITGAFKKEIFFHKTLFVAYEQLHVDQQVYNLWPFYYGGRTNLKTQEENRIKNEADEHALILQQSCEDEGYSIRRHHKYGFQYDEALTVVKTLAKFHALGISLKKRDEKTYDAARKCFDENKHDHNIPLKSLDKTIDHLISTVAEDPTVAKYKEKMKSNMEENNWGVWLGMMQQYDPWLTIIHGDLWMHNILINEDTEEPVKFLDFQYAKVGSPQADLVFFLSTSLESAVMVNDFDKLLDAYYNAIIESLQALNLLTRDFTRESFDERLRLVARTELFHCLMAIKFFTYDKKKPFDFNETDSIMLKSTNEFFENRAILTALRFIERDWL